MKCARMWAMAVLCCAPTVQAQQPTVQLESRVTGSQELPRVMYILPWRQPAEVEFNWQPEPGVAGDLFQPLRRDEYRRALNYRAMAAESAEPEAERELEE